MESKVFSQGLKPPCIQNNSFSIKAESGRMSKMSVKFFHIFAFPYFQKHSS